MEGTLLSAITALANIVLISVYTAALLDRGKRPYMGGIGGQGGENPPDVQKTAPPPPKPTTYLLLFPPLTGWPPEAAGKKIIFLFKIAKILPPFGGCKKIFWFCLLFSPSERRNLFPPPGRPKTTPHPPDQGRDQGQGSRGAARPKALSPLPTALIVNRGFPPPKSETVLPKQTRSRSERANR